MTDVNGKAGPAFRLARVPRLGSASRADDDGPRPGEA